VAKRTVLIAEANQEEADQMFKMVTSLGLRPVRARSAKEVVALCQAGVDCLFIDIKSPEMRAPTLLPEIRKLAQIPITVCTTGGTKEDVIFAMRHGCLDWIDKPVTTESMTNSLRRIARETKRLGGDAGNERTGARRLIKEIAERIRDGNIALPEVPSINTELATVLADVDARRGKIVKILRRDPSLVTRIIAQATGIDAAAVTGIESAIRLLGNATIANLIDDDEFFTFRSPAFKKVFEKMWKSHHITSMLAMEISKKLSIGNPEETFLFAVTHNVGELFLLRVCGELFQRHSNQVLSMDDVLNFVCDHHAAFGGGLLKKWELSGTYITIANSHHDTDSYQDTELDPSVVKILHIVNLSCRLTEYAIGSYYTKPLGGPSMRDSYDALEVSGENRNAFRRLAERLRDQVKEY
jgi:HD-like signal output (HDOD) protein/CheY-like chemotaxis protein